MSKATVPVSQLLIIDSQVNNWQSLADSVADDTVVLILDSSSDGLSQISNYLTALSTDADFAPLQSIHIISHGGAGSLVLGSNTISGSNLDLYSRQLAAVGNALTENGDILLYGCNVAADQAGVQFVNRFAALTNADVAASNDITGSALLGGDWQLEVATGTIESPLAVTAASLNSYSDILATYYGLDGADTLSGSDLADYIDGGNGSDSLTGNGGVDSILGGAGNDTLNGNASADTLDGGVGNDTLSGGTGADELYGGSGSDTLSGDTGNDILNGDVGNDTYKFAVGAGVDVISEYDTTTGNTDVVQFTDVKPTDLTALERNGDDLVFKYGSSDQLTVSDYFYTSAYSIEQFKFSDATVWNDANIKALIITNGDINDNSISGFNDSTNRINGLDGSDYLYGGALADSLDGGNGNDYLMGYAGADSLVGATGNDSLYGGSGADTLDGGIGNDTLSGDVGSDTYKLSVGAGVDVISEYDTTTGNTDVAQFTDVKSTDLTALECNGNDLVFKYGASDQLIVSNYFSTDTGYRIEQFIFSDAVSWDDSAIKARVITNGDAADNWLTGYDDGGNRIYGLDGNDYLYGGALTNTLDGGNGNDYLMGYAGADSLVGATGNDTLYGGGGADTLDGGIGNDTLSGDVGSDTYKLSVGAGVDVISEYDTTTGNTDVAQFTDVKSTDLTSLERNGNDLVFKYGASDQLIVSNYFSTDTGYRIEQFIFSDAVSWDDSAIKARVITNGDAADNSISGYDDGGNRIYGLDGNDYLYGGALTNTLDGGNGNDYLMGYAGADSLVGAAGNDTLYGGGGADTLDGGIGNDTLSGDVGSDTYKLSVGAGVDVISDYDTTVDNIDVVQFTDVKSTDLTALERKNDDLVLKYGVSDQLSVSNYFNPNISYRIEQFKFSDGVTWDDAGIKARVITNGDVGDNWLVGYNDGGNRIYGLDGNDYLDGGELADTIDGGNGNDNLTGNGGADNLIGGAGNDTISGNDDADTLSGGTGSDTLNGGGGGDLLDGGTGNDTLNGNEGDDTYKLAIGAGVDIISDYDVTANNTDTVQFDDVKSTDLTALERSGSDLVLKYGVSDQLIMSNYFDTNTGYRVERFTFSDAVSWDDSAIKARVITNGDITDNSISGYNDGGNRIYGLDGNDYLYGGELADTIDGGNGNDNLTGNAGADSLIGGAGNDAISGNDDADSLIGGTGNDSLYGGNGADELDGGAGSDMLNGDEGDDTYKLSKGAGADVISDYDTSVDNTDTVLFADIKSTDLTSLERKNDDLVLKYGTGDQLTVSSYFYGDTGYRIEQFKFSDGVTWDEAMVSARVIINGDAGDNSITGYNDGPNHIYGLSGNDSLYGSKFADTLDGGNGNDNLTGNAGADSLDGGIGNDTYHLASGAGMDVISDYDATVGNTDVVQFDDIESTAVTALARNNDDFLLQYGVGDQLIVGNYFSSNTGYRIEQFKFSDGVTWTESLIKTLLINLNGVASYTESATAVVLDSTVQIYYPELSAQDHYNGVVVSLARHGGANSQDVFSGSGDLTFNAGDVLLAGVSIGTVSSSNGTLSFNFNANATQARVNAALSSVAYSNSSDLPPASVQIDWTFNDGSAQGAVTLGSTVVNIASVNDAPTFSSFGSVVAGGNEDSVIPVTFANLQSQGNEADVDGTVTAFMIKAVTGGSLKIGSSTATATAWNATTNSRVDATHNVYWTPDANGNGVLNAFTAVAKDNGGLQSVAAIQATINVSAVDDAPTLTAFSSAVDNGAEDGVTAVTFADLQTQGNEADIDDSVVGFVIKAVSSGSLKIGSSADTATAWDATANNTVDATLSAYWTPAVDANGVLNAFTAVAKDSGGLESASAIQAKVNITAVNDAPTLTAFASELAEGIEDSVCALSFAKLQSQGNEADVDGSVTGFLIKAVNSGSLKIGSTLGTATAWDATANNRVDATHNAYWLPDANANGVLNAFTAVAIDDGGLESATAIQATINVTAVNDAPTLNAFAAQLADGNEDNKITVTLASLQTQGDAADIDGSVTAFVVKDVSNGNLKIGSSAARAKAWDALTNNSVDASHSAYWTPDANANGLLDAFTVVAKDNGGLQSATAIQATVNINAINDAPTLTAFSAAVDSGNEDGVATVTFTDLQTQGNEADIDDSVASFVIKAVSSGSLKIGSSADTATAWNASTNNTVDATLNAYWTPAANANGMLNAFTAVAKDGGGLESVGAIQAKVNVTAVNDAPTLTAFAANVGSGNEDSEIALSFAKLQTQGNEADIDGSVTGFLIKEVSSGSLKIGSTAITATAWDASANNRVDAGHNAYWTADADANGMLNAFTAVAIDDGDLESATAIQAKVNVTAVNDAPTLSGFASVLASGNEDNKITVTLANLQTQGDEADIDGSVTAFTIKIVSNGSLKIGGSAATAELWNAKTNNSVDATHNAYWTPDANSNGLLDAFTAVAKDNGGLQSAVAVQARLDIAAINDAPTLTAFSSAVAEGNEDSVNTIAFTDLQTLGNEADVDDSVTGFVIKSVSSGSLKIGSSIDTATAWNASTNNSIDATLNAYWTPAANANGLLNAFTVTAKDGGGLESATAIQAKANIAVVNDAPSLTDFSFELVSGDEDSVCTVSFAKLQNSANETDIDGSVTGFVIKDVSSGSLKIGSSAATAKAWDALTNNSVDASHNAYWTPDADANGLLDAFTVVARDNNGLESAEAVQATINVTPVNDAPTLTEFASAIVSGNEDSKIAVTLANLQAQGDEADIDGSVSAFVIKTVSNGSLQIGGSAATAKAWNAKTNNSIDASHNAYWLPDANTNGLLDAFSVAAKDNGGLQSAAVIQATVDVAAVNDAPTLTAFASTVANGDEDSVCTVSFAKLQNSANETDIDGSVTGFVIKAVSSGSLKIGSSVETATAWNAATNNTVDATLNAYWTAETNANGLLNAFTAVAKDSAGLESATAIQAKADIAAVNDAPTLNAFAANVGSSNEDSQITLSFAKLQAQGDETDVDGSVTGFAIKELSSGNLKIGTSVGTATAWDALTNNIVDAAHNAYWTPDANANGLLDAFTAVARDKGGLESANAIQATVAVAAVNDVPTGTVAILGAATQGQTLVASSNTLADVDGLDYGAIGYTWKTGSTLLGTGGTYTIAQDLVGKSITVTANYTDLAGTAEHQTSAATDKVVPPSTSAFIFTKNDLFTGEDGDTAKISMKLAVAPTRDVSVTFTSSDATEGTISNPTLTFTSSNWSTAQDFWIVGKNDYLNDGNQPYVINASISSNDVNYRQMRVDPIVIINNEDVTTANDVRIAKGTSRDLPIKLYGDIQVDSTVIIDGFFKPISTFPANDVLQGLDGNDTLYGGNLQDDLSGGIGDDQLYGENDEDFLYGEDGNDTLFGGTGVDSLEGGADDDILNGGVDDLMIDTMVGGAGNDTYYVGYGAVDVINDKGLATDIDTVIMPFNLSSYTLPSTIESGTIAPGSQASSLTGNTGNNSLTGNDGNNILNGALGGDSLVGGSGADVLVGGAGNDILSGGSGKDNFKFDAALKANTDKITDFAVADDTVQLENAIFTKLTTTGVLNANMFVKAAAAHDLNDYIVYNPTTGAVSYDADGSGAGTGVQIALLGVNLALTNADFVVI